jgi:hypothetical protein
VRTPVGANWKRHDPGLLERVGGTVIEEFQSKAMPCADRDGPTRSLCQTAGRCRMPPGALAVKLEGKDVIVVQAKKIRLRMCVMGLAVFSAELIKRFGPRSVKSIILCEKDDAVMRPLLSGFPNAEVVVMREVILKELTRPV